MTTLAKNYPPEAYSEDGVLWWELTQAPGSKRDYGAELKIMAWLAYNLQVGDTFTMRDLREAIGGKVANDQEHLNRRLRELRSRDKWVIHSKKDDDSLGVAEYRVGAVGWHPGLGTERAPSSTISQNVRRRVLDRDGARCVICGIGSKEAYPGEPDSNAVMTVGHIIPNAHGGSSKDLNNLRTECKRCNEPVREEIRSPETLIQVLPDVRRLRKVEAQRLLAWMRAGQRTKDHLDAVYDRARVLSPLEKSELIDTLVRQVGAGSS